MSSPGPTTVNVTDSPEAAAVAKIIADRPLLVKDISEADLIFVPDGMGRMRQVSGREVHAVYDKAPRRRTGTSRHDTLESFVAHVNRHKGETSVLFASKDGPAIHAVYDYNQAGPESLDGERARFAKHRANYAFPLSKEWEAWAAIENRALSQSEFATFLEDRIGDITDSVGEGMKETMGRLYIPTAASAARVLDLSRGLDIGENVKVSTHVKLASGETRVSFTSEHTDGNGNQIDVPQAFVIGIPVFDRGQPFQVLVRLRYRLKDGKLSWFVAPHAMDEILAFAFEEACKEAQEGTSLELFFGSPET